MHLPGASSLWPTSTSPVAEALRPARIVIHAEAFEARRKNASVNANISAGKIIAISISPV